MGLCLSFEEVTGGSAAKWKVKQRPHIGYILTDRGATVSLEFRFNEAGEVTGIYSAGRLSRFDGGYMQVPWEGNFRDYQIQSGMRAPLYGEVGWYDKGVLQVVWKGKFLEAQYDLEP